MKTIHWRFLNSCVNYEITGTEGDLIMTEVDTVKKYMRKMDALMLDLIAEVDIGSLPEEAGKAIMVISSKISEALKILESEED